MDHPILGTGVDTPLGRADPTKAEEAARYIRQAISHRVPREEIVNEIFRGVGFAGSTLWPKLALGYNNSLEPYEYDLQKAKELINKAGYALTLNIDLFDEYIYELIALYSIILLVVSYFVNRKRRWLATKDIDLYPEFK
ncbi:MAG: ABC transporter substrate-binding protein [Candidatus Kariarchaeaceae archaeon]|jgi:ABC-type oligopeptide transport system substrate-binding subunit